MYDNFLHVKKDFGMPYMQDVLTLISEERDQSIIQENATESITEGMNKNIENDL